MNTIGTKDIKLIHEKVLSLRGNINYKHISYRQLYFVAACSLLNPEVDGEIALKFRPYGGSIGIDNSKLDPLLKRSKVLRLHAALHDAALFSKHCKNKSPGYVYAFRYSPINNFLFGHLTGILFILSVKFLIPNCFVNWNARKFWQQNHKNNCPRSQRFQTQVTWIHYKRTQFVFQLERYNIFQTPT